MIEEFEPLQTERLHLEPISAEAVRAIVSGDVGALAPGEGWPQPGTRHGVALATEQGHPPGWLIRLDGEVIGDCGIRAPVDEHGGVEIGYGLAAPFQGRGFGTEAVMAITEWLLGQSSVSSVRARTDLANAASGRVLEKCGFSVVGTTQSERLYERRRASSVAPGRDGPR